MKKINRESLFQKITIAAAVVTLTIGISTQITSIFEPKKDLIFMLKEREELMNMMNDSLMLNIQKERNSLDDLIKSSSIDSIKTDFFLNKKLNKINERLNLLEEQNTALRQAINPINPDEILTIARLNDGIKILQEKNINSTKSIDEKFGNFRTAVFRELDASSKSINWLFAVLIPIVLNLLYTIWKDSKEKKSEK